MACLPYRLGRVRDLGVLHDARKLYDRFRYWLRGWLRG